MARCVGAKATGTGAEIESFDTLRPFGGHLRGVFNAAWLLRMTTGHRPTARDWFFSADRR